MSAAQIIPQTSTIDRVVEELIAKGQIDQVAKLLELKLSYDAAENRKAWIQAMAEFKAHIPVIERTKKVSIATKGGEAMEYSHAELDKVLDILVPEMRNFGLFPTWKPDTDSSGRVVVGCVITHTNGHSEEVGRLSGPADTSGGKNNIQAIGSTVTYLKRYTLFAGLGIEAKGVDDDGHSADKPTMPEDAINDYCVAMQDSMSTEELRGYFKDSWEKAKAVGDESAKKRLQKVYEQRKRDLFTAKQEASR